MLNEKEEMLNIVNKKRKENEERLQDMSEKEILQELKDSNEVLKSYAEMIGKKTTTINNKEDK